MVKVEKFMVVYGNGIEDQFDLWTLGKLDL
jgi:hypothetical protein